MASWQLLANPPTFNASTMLLLTDGSVLCSDEGSLFEFDPTSPVASALTEVARPTNADNAVFNGRMLLVPSGQVLYASGSKDIAIYTPDGGAATSWPQITAAPSAVQAGKTYTAQGTQLNGLSQAVFYGDDAQMATNYPLVRIQNVASSQVVYCRTHNHSTMGVATGCTVHSTQFTVPAAIETGPSRLVVVANGIASEPVSIMVTS